MCHCDHGGHVQGVPEKSLSCQKAYNSSLEVVKPRGSFKNHRFSFSSLGQCMYNASLRKSRLKRATLTQNLRQESVFSGTPCMVSNSQSEDETNCVTYTVIHSVCDSIQFSRPPIELTALVHVLHCNERM